MSVANKCIRDIIFEAESCNLLTVKVLVISASFVHKYISIED